MVKIPPPRYADDIAPEFREETRSFFMLRLELLQAIDLVSQSQREILIYKDIVNHSHKIVQRLSRAILGVGEVVSDRVNAFCNHSAIHDAYVEKLRLIGEDYVRRSARLQELEAAHEAASLALFGPIEKRGSSICCE